MFLSVLQFFAFCEPHSLNLSARFCFMLTIQNVRRATCNANHVTQRTEEMSSIKCATSHTTIFPCRYAQRSRWRQCFVSQHVFGNVVVVDLSDLSLVLGLVNPQISNLYFHSFSVLLAQPLLNVSCELHLRYRLLIPSPSCVLSLACPLPACSFESGTSHSGFPRFNPVELGRGAVEPLNRG